MESRLVRIYEEDYQLLKSTREKLIPMGEPMVDLEVFTLNSIIKQYEKGTPCSEDFYKTGEY